MRSLAAALAPAGILLETARKIIALTLVDSQLITELRGCVLSLSTITCKKQVINRYNSFREKENPADEYRI
jgi:hypothetical protein